MDLKAEDALIRSKNLRKRPLLNKLNLKNAYRNIYEKRKKCTILLTSGLIVQRLQNLS